MDTELYKVDIAFDVRPHWTDVPPCANIRLDQESIWNAQLQDVKSFQLCRYLPKGNHMLFVELYNKPENDCDQALEIVDLSLGRILSKQFVWQGVYRPRYPEPWASQQKAQGQELRAALTGTDYLGWNGTWCLQFSCPVFTWIHQIENLGWIYD